MSAEHNPAEYPDLEFLHDQGFSPTEILSIQQLRDRFPKESLRIGQERLEMFGFVPNSDWETRLLKGIEAGYYQVERPNGNLTTIPWLGKTCNDCPFFNKNGSAPKGFCKVWKEDISRSTATCSYFDPVNRWSAERKIEGLGYRRNKL